MKKINIKQIALAGVFLALLTIFKLFDIFMFRLNGYPIVEIYWIIGVLTTMFLNYINLLLVLTIAPFFWILIGQIELFNPWSIILDYFLPMIFLVFIKFHKNIVTLFFWILFAGLLKLISHTISGMIFYNATLEESLIINSPFVFVNISISLFLILLLFKRIKILRKSLNIFYPFDIAVNLTNNKKISKFKLVKIGYLNNVYSFFIEKEKNILKISKFKIVDKSNEFMIYEKLFPNKCFFDKDNNYFIKPFIDGKKLFSWNENSLNLLNKEIKKFHKIHFENLLVHDWNQWNCFAKKISSHNFLKYRNLVKKYKNKNLVTSHNDINRKNVIKSKNKIFLIDFEWVRKNHYFFDYANFYIFENIHICKEIINNQEYKDLIYMTLIFNLLWSYSIKYSIKIFIIRFKLKNKLKKLLI